MIKGEESNERIKHSSPRGNLAKSPGLHFCQMAVPDLTTRQEKIGTTSHIKLLDCPLKGVGIAVAQCDFRLIFAAKKFADLERR
jgi:hypothetical protein